MNETKNSVLVEIGISELKGQIKKYIKAYREQRENMKILNKDAQIWSLLKYNLWVIRITKGKIRADRGV